MSSLSLSGPRCAAKYAYGFYLDWFVKTGALLVVIIGVSVTLGWILEIDTIKGPIVGLATMKVNTSICFVAAAVSLDLLNLFESRSLALPIARGLAVVVTIVGVLSLAENIFGFDMGLDQLLVTDGGTLPGHHPGLMSPGTSVCFTSLGLALLFLKSPTPHMAASAHWLVVPALFLSALALVGYTYGVDALSEIRLYTTMAAHTALSFFILALAIMATDTGYGFAGLATSDTAGGLVCRRLIPTLPFLLFWLGWLHLSAGRAGVFGYQFGIALLVILSIAVSTIAVASTAVTLHKTDLVREKTEGALRTLNAELEERVADRTRQLELANKSLEQLSLEDGLTHLANRRFFDNYLESQMGIAVRYRRNLALVMCDIDFFKAYNDRYGHPAGDACLKQVAAAIASCCHRNADMAARYGGEEFAIVLPETDLAGALKIAEAAREAVVRLQIPHGATSAGAFVSISGGVSILSGQAGFTAQRLISEADRTLYKAKRLGRNRMVGVTPETVSGWDLDAPPALTLRTSIGE